MNKEKLSYLLPHITDQIQKLGKELKITKYLLYFLAGIVVSGLILNII